MARLEIHGLGLNVEVAGAGPPLLLLHGFTGAVATWQEHLPAFARHNQAIAVDLIGHSASEAPPDPSRYSMSRCIDDLLAVLDHLELRRAAVLGYSMGARVALHLAAAVPDRVGALVLESGSPGLADPAERAARRAADAALAERIEREGVEAFVDYWEGLLLFASQQTLPPQVRKRLRMQRLRNSPTGLANSLRGMGTGAQEPLWDRLNEMMTPALIVAGTLDLKYRLIAQEMARALPHAELEFIHGAGHAVHLERPELFDRLAVDFIGEYGN